MGESFLCSEWGCMDCLVLNNQCTIEDQWILVNKILAAELDGTVDQLRVSGWVGFGETRRQLGRKSPMPKWAA